MCVWAGVWQAGPDWPHPWETCFTLNAAARSRCRADIFPPTHRKRSSGWGTTHPGGHVLSLWRGGVGGARGDWEERTGPSWCLRVFPSLKARWQIQLMIFVCVMGTGVLIYCLVAQSCLILCNPMGCSPPGSTVHGVSQARIPEWVTITFSRGSSQPRDRTPISCLVGGFFTSEPPGKSI